MERTGYSMIQENGQRKYGGPPPGWEGPTPPRGCEVFVGKIPRDCYENELVPIFETIGKIYELRLMMDFSGSNRGYAFIMFTTKADARRAVKEMNNYEIRKGRFLGVCQSVENCRLFVGGIPKTKSKEEILAEMVKVTEGVVDVIVYPSASDKSKNRGFAFVEFESHRAAAMARRKLIPGRIQLWGHQIAVDWAEPENEVDEDIMKTVKILYVRNLMLNTTEELLEEVFTKACGKTGTKAVERVKKLKDYAFVHFIEREDAIRAMNALDGEEIDGSRVEVVLAKPVDKNDPSRQNKNKPGLSSQQIMSNMIPALPFDPQTLSAYYAQFGALPGSEMGFPASMAASSLVSRGPNRAVLRGRGRGAAGSRAAGNRIYGVRRKCSSPSEVLEFLCQRSGWGIPIYQLNSVMGREGTKDVQLFLFKVIIPAIANSSPSAGTFIPNKVSRTVEEAQNYAAEYVLMSLGMPYDGSGGMLPLPPTFPFSPLGAFGYLGQPITAAQTFTHLGNGPSAADLALYSMQAYAGLAPSGAVVSPSQPLMMNGEQNQPEMAVYSASPMISSADLQATFSQYY